MTADLDALAASTPEDDIIYCECGCGGTLPAGSTRRFKRGHKATPRPDEPPEPSAPFTIADARESVPDDPDPADQAEHAKAAPVRVTKRVRDDIEGKLGMIYGFIALGVQMRDPVCGGALEEHADTIVTKMVPIICKSPELVRWFTKGGGYMIWFELLMVFMPVFQVIAQHHIFHTIDEVTGHDGVPLPNPVAYRAA